MGEIDQRRCYVFGLKGEPDNEECYVFGIKGNLDSTEGMESLVLEAPANSTPNDFRVIISLCCTLILRYGANLDPETIASIRRIQQETGLIERSN